MCIFLLKSRGIQESMKKLSINTIILGILFILSTFSVNTALAQVQVTVVSEAAGVNVLKSIGNRNFDAISNRASFLQGASRIEVANPIGFWANFDVSQIETKFEGASTVQFDGAIFNANAGIDRTFTDGTIFGLGFGHYNSELDFTSGNAKGIYDLGIEFIQPYVTFEGVGNSQAWAALGFGNGEYDISGNDQIQGTDPKKADVQYISYGLGMNTDLSDFYTTDGSFVQINFLADIHGTRLDIESLDQNLDNHSLRVGLEYLTNYQLENGDFVEPVFNVNFRGDKNDSDTKTLMGYEVVGGLRYLTGEQFTIETNVKFTSIPATDYSEVGGVFALRVEPINTGIGTSFIFEPSYGSQLEDENGIWDFNNKQDKSLNLLSELAYGIGYQGGIFTPYSKYTIKDEIQSQSLGFRINKGEDVRWNLSFNNSDLASKDNEFKVQYNFID